MFSPETIAISSDKRKTNRHLSGHGLPVPVQSDLSDVDADTHGPEILNHKVFLSVGHDEYWSQTERANVQTAINAGVNAQFLSGNEVYWDTRLGNSVDGSNTPDRTIISYKETWSNAKIDPKLPLEAQPQLAADGRVLLLKADAVAPLLEAAAE